VILVNPKHTTKMCSSCGEMLPKALSVRVHTFPVCGLVLERDHHAALNTLQRGLQALRLSYNECGTAHSEAQVLEHWKPPHD
jgi:putative transposase